MAATILMPASAPAQPMGLDRIVAVVENKTITERQLRQNIRRAKAALAQQNRELPDERTLTAQVLQQMVIQQLQLQEAKRLGIVIDDITLSRAVEEMAKRNNMSLAEFKRQIERDDRSFEEVNRKIRDELTIRQLIQREVINRIEVSEQEIENVLMLDENRRRNAEYHVVHLRVPPQESADKSAAARTRLMRVRRQLRNDSFSSLIDLRKRFARLWRAAAADGRTQLRYQVKDLDWRRAENLPAPVRRRLKALRDTPTSPVISNRDGLHLFQLLASRSGSPEMMQLQHHVRHILIQTNPIDDDDKVRRKLMKIKRQLQNGADFEDFACRYSQDPLSSMKGGDLGWSSPGNYVPEFAEAVARAHGKGDIVGPFKSSFGWHLLEVLDTREHDIGDDTIHRQAIAEIRKRKSDEETRLWLLKLREERRVEIRI